jgi:uncharacterized protein YgbK (DUF1537 family)
MIAAIADDLTGAVEIAGIGLRYGLRVEIVTALSQNTGVDLLVVASDTRSMTENAAATAMADITAQLKKLNPRFLFKKVDSVLRGHVLAELRSHLQQLGLEKALLVPANPTLNRIISNGQYYVDGQPIHLSSFANDPDFAITGAEIHAMLRCDKSDITIKTTNDALPVTGITVGECSTEADLKKWAGEGTLLAGGSGFFAAILESRGHLPQTVKPTFSVENPVLMVSGTTFEKSRQLIQQLKNAGGPVSYMPPDIVTSTESTNSLYNDWADEVTALLNLHNKAIIAIEGIVADATNLRQKKALLVEKVLTKIAVKELLIEGGATASSIIKQLNLTCFTPVQELNTGVVRMKTMQNNGLFLTLKPGSYTWPAQVWDK